MSGVQQMDLVIRGGTVITASSRFQADVGVRGGAIAQFGGEMTAESEIDASGKLVLPGGIEMHVHFTGATLGDEEFRWADDFASGTRAAAAGGVTTIGDIVFPRPGERLLSAIDRALDEAKPAAIVDYVLHPVVLEPSAATRAELAVMAERGHRSLKIFMVLGNFDGQAREHLGTMRVAGEHGMISMIHCEDECVVGHLTERLMNAGRTGAEWHSATRPVFAEEIAVTRAIGFAEAAEAPIYIVHLSSQAALEASHRARARGAPIYVETRPLYLHLTDERYEESGGAKYIGSPPLRKASDVDALWHGIWDADIQTVCTDHAALKLEQKLDPTLTVENFRQGVADLETLQPMLFSEGVNAGRISLHRFVEVTSTNAARLFGLFPRKGTIAVGADADIAIWDPELTRRVDGAQMETNSDYSPYDGWEVTGWPVTTISRGEIVYEHGQVVGKPGRGQLVRQGPTQML
jgi:dihydropyrimidinase